MRDRFNAAGGGLPGGGPAQAGQGPRGARGASPCRAEQAQSAAGTPSIEMIDNILRFRAKRRTLFSPDLFGEPAWEILLELYRGELGGKRETVSGLCVASGVPATTALRWIGNLEREGWIERDPDPIDRRRFFVRLSKGARETMNRLFLECPLNRYPAGPGAPGGLRPS